MPDVINPFLLVWEAVKFVETRNNPDTINYTEMAYGPGQIRQEKLDDFNLANGTNFTLIDCLDEKISKRIFMWHCMRYNECDLAIRRWNGSGPETYKYLEKVNEVLRTLSPARGERIRMKEKM